MAKRINRFIIKAQWKWKNFVEDFKNDENGLSGVVVAVLLILVAVLAIGLLWGLLSGAIQDWWTKIIGETDTWKKPK